MDEQLMRALYEEHSSALLGFVLHYSGDRQRAEDVVQETFLRAWKHIGSVDAESGNPRAYLFTVARNVMTDQWRSESRRPRLVSDEAAVQRVPTDGEVDAALDSWVIAEALDRLSADHRAVVQALYYEGRTVAATADLLRIAPGTVKSRSYYAVRALRVAFEEMGVVR